jgi:hypothetical protein
VTGVEYRLHRGRAWLSVFAMAAFCLWFGFVGLVITETGWRIACFAAAAGAALGIAHTWRLLADPRPILRIAPDGLLSTPFSDQVVPWSEITEMTRVLYYNRSVWMGRTNWTRMPSHDQLFFAVADERLYPNGPGRWFTRTMQKLGGTPPINIQLWIVDAGADAIAAEIAKHWAGQIKLMDMRPAHLVDE